MNGEISVEDLAGLQQRADRHAVLDVREAWEREICALPDSLPIPLGDLPARVGELPVGVPLVVMCHHGFRSAQAVAWLGSQGYDTAVNLSGGIDAWARRIDPSMKVY